MLCVHGYTLIDSSYSLLCIRGCANGDMSVFTLPKNVQLSVVREGAEGKRRGNGGKGRGMRVREGRDKRRGIE